MASQNVEFFNSKGMKLSGVLEHSDSVPKGWALFAHCFTCSKKGLAASRISRALASRGIGVLRFDFTGLGESEGEFSDTGFSSNVADILAASQWMSENGQPLSLLVGHSLGGAAILVAANQLPEIKAVVTLGAPAEADHVIEQFKPHLRNIEATGEAIVDLAGRPFTVRKSFIEDIRGAAVRDAAAALKRPLLVMHSPTDETVGIDNATSLFLAARHPKSFVSLDGADHLLTDRRDAEYAADVIAGWSSRFVVADTASSSAPMQTHDVIVRETGYAGSFQNEVFAVNRRYLADEPTSVGGGGTGPDPYEWVSAGLGACTSMTLRMYAARKDWPLSRVTVKVNHSKVHPEDCVDCGPKDRIDQFDREILIEGDLDETQRARLLEIADRCPVHRTLESTSVITTRAVTQSA